MRTERETSKNSKRSDQRIGRIINIVAVLNSIHIISIFIEVVNKTARMQDKWRNTSRNPHSNRSDKKQYGVSNMGVTDRFLVASLRPHYFAEPGPFRRQKIRFLSL